MDFQCVTLRGRCLSERFQSPAYRHFLHESYENSKAIPPGAGTRSKSHMWTLSGRRLSNRAETSTTFSPYQSEAWGMGDDDRPIRAETSSNP